MGADSSGWAIKPVWPSFSIRRTDMEELYRGWEGGVIKSADGQQDEAGGI